MSSITNPSAGRFGTAVFLTQDGLIAEGDGDLSFISENFPVVEFRDGSQEMAHLPPGKKLSAFMSRIVIDGDRAMLLGMVRRQRDATGRDGFLGVCCVLDEDTTDLLEHFKAVRDLFNEFSQYYEQHYKNVRHADTIGFLSPSDSGPMDIRRLTDNKKLDAFLIHPDLRRNAGLSLSLLSRACAALEGQSEAVLMWLGDTGGPHEELTEQLVSELEDTAAIRAELMAEQEVAQGYETGIEIEDYAPTHPQGDPSYHHEQYAPPPPPMTHQDAPYSAESDQETAQERHEKFRERTPFLRYPRPDYVDAETEDYLIGLISFVIEQKGTSRRQSASAKSPRLPSLKKKSSGAFSQFNNFGEDSGDFKPKGKSRFGSTGVSTEKLVLGVLLVAVLIALTFGALFISRSIGSDQSSQPIRPPTSQLGNSDNGQPES